MEGIIFSKIRDEAIFPTKATSGSACWDLYAAEDVILHPHNTVVVKTGLVVKMPSHYMMQIYSRSGNSSKGLVVANAPGIVDSDYTPKEGGDPFDFEIKVILHFQDRPYIEVKKGDKIAQCSFVQVDNIRVFNTNNWENATKLGEIPGTRIVTDPLAPNGSGCFLQEIDAWTARNDKIYDLNLCEIKDRVREGGLGSTDLQKGDQNRTYVPAKDGQMEHWVDKDGNRFYKPFTTPSSVNSNTQSEINLDFRVEDYHAWKKRSES